MIGWHITVFRKVNGGSSPASTRSKEGARVAVWQTGAFGLGWLNALVKEGKAVAISRGGYPSKYTARAKYLIPRIVGGPPEANSRWVREAHDVVTTAWEGTTVIDRTIVNDCRDDEWLLVVAWDES